MVQREGLVEDQRKKLLIFTEHKDTLDYLVENLKGDFEVAQIHGRLKLAERIAQERYFREAGSNHGGNGSRGRGYQPPVLPPHRQLRHPVEPEPARTAHGSHPSDRTDRGCLRLQPGGLQHPEGYVLATILRKMQNMGEALGDPVFDVIGKTSPATDSGSSWSPS